METKKRKKTKLQTLLGSEKNMKIDDHDGLKHLVSKFVFKDVNQSCSINNWDWKMKREDAKVRKWEIDKVRENKLSLDKFSINKKRENATLLW